MDLDILEALTQTPYLWEIATLIGISNKSVNIILEKLIAKGYVQRDAPFYRLTPLGYTLLDSSRVKLKR